MGAVAWGNLMAVSCAALWAVAVLLFKRSGERIPPIALNVYKSVIAALLFLPVLILTGRSMVPDGALPRDIMLLILSGFIGITVADSLFFRSLNILGAGLSAIVDCLYSPLVILMSLLILDKPVTSMEFLGGALVIAGVLIATLNPGPASGDGGRILHGVILGAAAMLAIALSVMAMEPAMQKGLDPIWITEVRMLAGMVTLIVFGLFHGNRREIFRPLIRLSAWKYAFPGTVIGNVLAMVLWIAAFQKTEIASAAILNQTSTIFIVVLSSVFLRETFTRRKFLATLLAFAGSVIVVVSG